MPVCESECGEHPDRVQGDEQVEFAAEVPHERDRQDAEQHDAVLEDEPVTEAGQGSWQVPIARHDAAEPGEVSECRVGGEHEDGRRGHLDVVEADRSGAKYEGRDLGNDRSILGVCRRQ
jgi:hypothetical protein